MTKKGERPNPREEFMEQEPSWSTSRKISDLFDGTIKVEDVYDGLHYMVLSKKLDRAQFNEDTEALFDILRETIEKQIPWEVEYYINLDYDGEV